MNEHSHVRIESPAFPADSVQLIELGGRETIGQLFELHAQVVSSDPAGLDVDALIGASAALVFERGGVEVRRMGGLVASIRDSMHEETGRMVYDLWFAPRAFRLGLVETYEIFMDLSVPDIVKKKLERAGLVENQDFEFRLVASYPPREFVVQYKETDLAFVSRLLEHVGVSFFFEHKDGVDIFVLADANSGFAPLTDRKEAPFRSRGERLGVFAIESQTRMTPAQYIVKDYNYRTPQLALQASAPNEKGDGGHVMEYGAHFKNPDEGAQIAKIRAEELAAGRTVLDGKSDRHTFSAGAMFLLEDHPRGDVELLLTEVHHRAATSALGAGKENMRDYENSFHAIPYKTPFRPARITPKPRIHGVITGVIDAAAKGPYAELDADGRYRVRFLFDGGDAADGQASRLCRMAQPHGGGGYGMHFPLRSGVEVILTFMEGDPDRPIILGVVPNPQTPSPVTGGNGTRNIIRTGGGNEINIDDTAGAERIKLSTPRSRTVFQLGAPNAAEDGACLVTDAGFSAVVNTSVALLSPVLNTASSYFKIKSAADITQFCGVVQNIAAVRSAWAEAIGTGFGDLKGLFDAGNAEPTAFGDKLNEDVEEREHKQALLEEEIKKLQTGLDATIAAAAMQNEEVPKEVLDAQKAEIEDGEKALQKKKEEAQTQAAEIEKDKLKVAAYKTKVADSWGHAASEVVDKFKTVSDAAKPFFTTLADHAGFLAQFEAEAMAGIHVASANATSVGGHLSFLVPVVTTPAFTGGGEVSAALIGGVCAFVGSAKSVVAGEMEALLTAGSRVAVKTLGQAELSGAVNVFINSVGGVLVEANTEDISLQAGLRDVLVDAGRNIKLEAKGRVDVEAGDDFSMSTKKKATFVAEEGPATLIARQKDVGLKADKGNLFMRAAEEKSKVDLKSDQIKLAHQDWSVTITNDGIQIKKMGVADAHISVTGDKIMLKKGTLSCQVDNYEAKVVHGNNSLHVSKDGCKANATRIDLDCPRTAPVGSPIRRALSVTPSSLKASTW